MDSLGPSGVNDRRVARPKWVKPPEHPCEEGRMEQEAYRIPTVHTISALRRIPADNLWPLRSPRSSRFIESIAELCPDVVDAPVAHAKVEQAFATGRRDAKAPPAAAARSDPHTSTSCITRHTGLPLRQRHLQARSSGRDETDINSSRLGPRSGGIGKLRRSVEGSPGETSLVDRFDGPRRAFRAER
jgi:hypothetical protein